MFHQSTRSYHHAYCHHMLTLTLEEFYVTDENRLFKLKAKPVGRSGIGNFCYVKLVADILAFITIALIFSFGAVSANFPQI